MQQTIGENIKIMRKKCGFTQDELASRLSVTPQAISKWENGNGLPDITQLIPLAKIFGVTTDSLLGIQNSFYGKAHIEAVEKHIELLMSASKPIAEKCLSAYIYLRGESEKEPTNYTLMCRCISYGAEISRYADFNGFLADDIGFRDEIFKDCEHKNGCITKYCDDNAIVEESDFAMAWIYIHLKKYDKAKYLIDRLPSLESNSMKESIMAQLINFQYGFKKEKEYINDNIRKLMRVTAKEFIYSFEDYAHSASSEEAIEIGNKFLDIIEAYKAFEYLNPEIIKWEFHIRKYLPKCYVKNNDFERASNELLYIDKLLQKSDFSKAKATKLMNDAIKLIDEKCIQDIKNTDSYKKLKYID